MKKHVAGLLIIIVIMLLHQGAFAESTGGEMIVRVPDGLRGTCVNINSDTISMTMRRIIVNKEEGFFTSDKEVGVKLETTVSGGKNKVSFPRMFKTSVSKYGEGHVSLPVEQSVFDDLKLLQNDQYVQSVEVSFTLLKKKQAASFGVAIEALADITKNLPLPPNPYVEGFNFFAQYANGVLSKSLNEANNVDAQLPSAKATLKFTKNASCGDAERSGTLAVIQAESAKNITQAESRGYVVIDKLYCYQSELVPTFMLKFATRPINGECSEVSVSDYKPVMNTYYAFFLNITDRVLPLEFEGAKDLQDSVKQEAIARCSMHGIGIEKCLKKQSL